MSTGVAGAPLPHLLSSGLRSFVAFYLEEHDPDWDGTYVRVVDPTEDVVESLPLAEFKGWRAVELGPPNDEVLHGHPLYGRGLVGYGTYVVENSRWLADLIEINRVNGVCRFQSLSCAIRACVSARR